jgi:hypothetical protein
LARIERLAEAGRKGEAITTMGQRLARAESCLQNAA